MYTTKEGGKMRWDTEKGPRGIEREGPDHTLFTMLEIGKAARQVKTGLIQMVICTDLLLGRMTSSLR